MSRDGAPADRPGGGDGHELRMPIRPELAAMSSVRRRVREHLDAGGVHEDARDTLLLVVDEIVSNSIEHGARYRQTGDRLELVLRLDGADVQIVFVDEDVPPEEVRELADLADGHASGHDLPAFDNERGRGLFLITTGLDRFEIRPQDEQTGSGLVFEGHKRGVR